MSSMSETAAKKIKKPIFPAYEEVTCDCCARPHLAGRKRYYCAHCNKYYYVCTICAEDLPKCRYCGIPLKKKLEPIPVKKVR